MSRRDPEKKATRHVGECQVCEKLHKLKGGLLVHHGYKRPGYGQIEGDCPGVFELPYEKSCDVLRAYLPRVEESLRHLRHRLAKFHAGEVTSFTKPRYDYVQRRDVLVTFTQGVTPEHEWRYEVRYAISNLESDVRQSEAEVHRVERRIAAWKPRETMTFEESVARERERAKNSPEALAKAVARAEREVKKAEKLARKQALDSKRAAEKHAVILEIRRLAAEDVAVPSELVKLVKRLRKMSTWIWYQELGEDKNLEKLGLATPIVGTDRYYYPRL